MAGRKAAVMAARMAAHLVALLGGKTAARSAGQMAVLMDVHLVAPTAERWGGSSVAPKVVPKAARKAEQMAAW